MEDVLAICMHIMMPHFRATKNVPEELRAVSKGVRTAFDNAFSGPGSALCIRLPPIDRQGEADGADAPRLALLPGLPRSHRLHITNAQVVDLGVLSALTQLQYLNLRNNRPLKNLDPLAGLVLLQHLDLSETSVDDLGPLVKLTLLQHLDLSKTFVYDLGPLAELTLLQHLDLSETDVKDVGPLVKLTLLQHLDLRCAGVKNVAPLAKLTLLQRLNLSHNKVSDVRPLAGLTKLQHLDLTYNILTDVRSIAGLPQLRFVRLSSRGLEVSQLAGLPADCKREIRAW